MHDGAPVNIEALQEMLAYVKDRGSDFAMGLLEVYERSAGRDARELAKAVQAGDLAQVVFYSHRLKGSSSNVGAVHLAQCCRDIHAAAVRGDVDAVRELGRPVESLMAATLDALRTWCVGIAADEALRDA